MNRYLTAFLLLLLLTNVVHAGCRASRTDALAASLAEDLLTSLQSRLDRSKPIMVTTFVDLHDMDRTCDLGRIISDKIASQLTGFGYRILEPHLGSTPRSMKNQPGEFILSRELQQANSRPDVPVFLTGTYAQVENAIAISAKLIDAGSQSVLAAATCELRISEELQPLLTQVTRNTAAPIQMLKNPKIKSDAKAMQQQLMSKGFYRGKIDGAWGKQSKEALLRYKHSNGLPANSIWDQTTQSRLFDVQQ